MGLLKSPCQPSINVPVEGDATHLGGLIGLVGHLAPLVVPPSGGLLQLLVRRLSQASGLLFGVTQRRLQLHNQLPTNTDGILLSVFQGLGSAPQPDLGLIRTACVGNLLLIDGERGRLR